MEILENDAIRLRAFSTMARDIVASRTLSETLDQVMAHIGSVFGPLTWSFLLRDSQKGTLKFVHATGPGADSIRGMVLQKGQGVAGWVAEHGAPLLVANTALDHRFTPEVDQTSGFVTKSIIAVPLKTKGKVYGVIELINKLDESEFTDRDLVVLQTIADFAAIAIERAYYWKALQKMALTDPLTGMANRRAFDQVLGREIEKTKRTQQLFSLLILDIDHFKAINDRHGHLVGDAVLKTVARILMSTSRKIDFAARLGGDEFAVLLPETSEGEAPYLVRRIQRMLDDHNQTAEVQISMSIGARVVDPRSPETILEQADQAMYLIKAQNPPDASGELEGQLASWLDQNGKD